MKNVTPYEYLRAQGVSCEDLEKFNELWPKVQKQAKIKEKFRLPSFDCPNCNAKHILFAGDAVRKNETILKTLEEKDIVDYVIICPKCKKHIGVRRNAGVEICNLQFRTVGYHPIPFCRVYNHRLLTEKEMTADYLAGLLMLPGEFADENAHSESRLIYTVKVPYRNYRGRYQSYYDNRKD